MAEDNEETIQALHKNLVDQVKAKGFMPSRHVETAFRAVPRHLFLPNLPPQEVYQDKAIITKSVDGHFVSSSSQPTIMAIMLEQLDLHKGQHILEIGAGTGYNAALIAHIVGKTGHVVTIDIDEDIVEDARKNLVSAGFASVQVVCADGGLGFPDAAPYDRIILTVNASDITPAWHEQLTVEGRLLLPFSVRGPQIAVAFKRMGNHFESVSVQPCGFIGLRGAFAEQGLQVQLDRGPGQLYLTLSEQLPVHRSAISQWLSGPAQDIPTQVQLTVHELFAGLHFWLALHEFGICTLTARGSAIGRDIVLNLFPLLGNSSAYSTIGVLSQNALSVLTYTVDQTEKTSVGGTLPALSPVHIVVRTFGEDNELAQHLVSLIERWNTLGRPNEQKLRIYAYMNEQTFVPDKQDIIIKKHWTQFVFRW